MSSNFKMNPNLLDARGNADFKKIEVETRRVMLQLKILILQTFVKNYITDDMVFSNNYTDSIRNYILETTDFTPIIKDLIMYPTSIQMIMNNVDKIWCLITKVVSLPPDVDIEMHHIKTTFLVDGIDILLYPFIVKEILSHIVNKIDYSCYFGMNRPLMHWNYVENEVGDIEWKKVLFELK